MALQLTSMPGCMSPMVSAIITNMASAGGGEGAVDASVLMKIVLDGIRVLDDSISKFIQEIGDGAFGRDDAEILDGYYDATLKCKTAALNVLRAASGSETQLNNLRGALNHMSTNIKEGGHVEYEAASEADALNEIKCLDCAKFNLPDTLLNDLEAAKIAYEGVIRLCSVKLAKTENAQTIAFVAMVGLIVLGVVLTPVLVSAPFLFLTEAAVETVVQLAFIAGGFTITVGITSVLAKQILDLCKLMKALREQWELLTSAELRVGGLVAGIRQLQTEVEMLQIELQNTCDATGFVQRLNNLLRLRDVSFRHNLDKQVRDISDLKQSAYQLTKNVLKAFDVFKEKSMVITRPITGSYNK